MKTTQVAVRAKTQRVYDYIYDYIKGHGYSPSVRDISTALNLVVSNTNFHIDRLEEGGYVTKARDIARTIQLPGTVTQLPARKVIA